MANNDECKTYALKCIMKYLQMQNINVSFQNIYDLLFVIKDRLNILGSMGFVYTQEEFDVLLATFCSNINSFVECEEIKGYIREYCLKWTEMSIPSGKDEPVVEPVVVRPPYVLNGTNRSCKITEPDGYKDYKFISIENKEKLKFKEEDKILYVTVEKEKDTEKDTYYFAKEGTKDKVTLFFDKESNLKSYDGLKNEDRWIFENNEGYVVRGRKFIKINEYIKKRYTGNKDGVEFYNSWKDKKDKEGKVIKGVQSQLAECRKEADNQRKSYDHQFYGGEDIGKAHPDTIVNYLKSRFSKKSSKTDLEKEMRDDLENFCIGIDCSGFVSRAIAYAMEQYGKKHGEDIEENYAIQWKTLGLISDSDDSILLNNAATTLKYFRGKKEDDFDDTGSIVFPDLEKEEKEKKKNKNKNKKDQYMGSRLIYQFEVKKEKGETKMVAKKVNKDINQCEYPLITSLRPGDIVIMANNENFDDGFHIGIICDVGIDKLGPYFITADSSPVSIEDTVKKKIKDDKNYAVLKKPEPNSDNFITTNMIDKEELSTYLKGNGVRYILHRGFGFFNNKEFLAFRRPYAFDKYYRGSDKDQK